MYGALIFVKRITSATAATNPVIVDELYDTVVVGGIHLTLQL